MKQVYFFCLIALNLLDLMLPGGKVTAQTQSLCGDYSFFPFKKNKKPADTTCIIVDNGFMYAKANEISKLSGLPMNFIVCKTSGVNNAFAFMDKDGNRYIKYDEAFISRMNTDSSADESSILFAHEVGHHVYFHTIANSPLGFQADNVQKATTRFKTTSDSAFRQEEQDYFDLRQRQELEADRFAGFIMARKGIPLDKGERFFKKLDRYYRDKGDSTHPPFAKRIEALKEGFDYAGTLAKNQPINPSALGKQNTNIVYRKTSKLERDLLLSTITSAIQSVQEGVSSGKYRAGYGTGLTNFSQLDTNKLRSLRTYLGRDFSPNAQLLDDEQDYFQLVASNFNIQNSSPYTSTAYLSGYHIRAGWFYLVLFIPGKGVQVGYKARFEKDQISLDEIKLLFSQVFMPVVQKLFDSYSQ